MNLLDKLHSWINFAQCRKRNDLTLYLRGKNEKVTLGIVEIDIIVIESQLSSSDVWSLLNFPIMPIKEDSPYIAIIGQNSTQWAIYIKDNLSVEGTNDYGLPITDWGRA